MRVVIAGLLVLSSIVSARSLPENAGDHYLFSRYPGAEIRAYHSSEYDEARLLISAIREVGDRYNRKEEADFLNLEGRLTNIEYRIKGTNDSVFQMMRNYQKVLKKLNAEILFSCRGDDCGKKQYLYTSFVNNERLLLKGLHIDSGDEVGLITAELNQNDQKVWIGLVIGADDNNKFRSINLSVIEEEKLDEDKLSVISLEDLENKFQKTGKMILGGIYFDHDKAEVKDNSKQALSAIAKYLKAHKQEKVFIVGHTDTVGSEKHNIQLSTDRANAVVKALVKEFGIAEERIKPRGVGPFSPVARNDNDEGRKLNRRVEMIRIDS